MRLASRFGYANQIRREPDDDDDETWVLFNAMNGTSAF